MSLFANVNAKTSCALLHFHPEEEAAWHSAFLYIGLNEKLHTAVFGDYCVYFTTLISHIFADNFTIANKEQFKIQPFLIPSTSSGIDNSAFPNLRLAILHLIRPFDIIYRLCCGMHTT